MRIRRHYDRLPARPANRASMRGLLAAQAALYGPSPELTSNDVMAERERIRIEDERHKQRQGVLALHARGST
jgi:hypothetical protein